MRPSERAVTLALRVLKRTQEDLEHFAAKNGLPIRVGILQSGIPGRFQISMHSRADDRRDGRFFLNHDGSRRDSTCAFAHSYSRAEAIILEAAQARVAKRRA